LRAVKKGDKIIESYKVVTLTIVSDEDEDEGIVAPLAEGSKSESRWDTAGGVRAYSTVNYDRSIDGNLYLYKLTSVSGGWERHDSSYVLSDRKVNYGATGTTKEGGFANQSSGFLYPTSDTYSYTAPSNWVPVWQSYMIFGTNSWVTIKRGTSSEWELHLSNLVA